jgi:hypothetical protein
MVRLLLRGLVYFLLVHLLLALEHSLALNCGPEGVVRVAVAYLHLSWHSQFLSMVQLGSRVLLKTEVKSWIAFIGERTGRGLVCPSEFRVIWGVVQHS